ncbi:flagellar biosynthesis anti-sigma factor FlgM [Aneurinibacillus sp. Ricciae_BoGa-3]|uniref:flagellar biosynthesis anti-sigma factor FlgM n=1 Tax=Aneurinibacillus sp. Ricciae_BoGa-3 TaxID=3022697 RepID=UPI002340A760|nr:flagellar biosynthesis anti-sigma factor FlgM [Aneurinibacillus sp. Ricciae_BoGa-3]WCK54201.1 flagellar biosynthesis anti-sigma factor FlgM [Aneurinibacillus sp. Ricciae_BoGa-3]
MRIDRPNGIQPVNPYNKQNAKLEEANRTRGQDKLEISPEALDLHKTQETEAQRAERIAKLKQQVQAGTYRVDADKVAEKIIKGGI